MESKFEKYCTGCGLCASLKKADLIEDNKGFSHPINYDTDFLSQVCPVAGIQSARLSKQNFWGRSEAVYLGWSTDTTIREQASSGGILTTIAEYLLTENVVDGIIHIHVDSTQVYRNRTVISTTKEQVLAGSGSRYSISHPLDIIGKIDHNKTYCLIAKPCDINVFRNYAKLNPKINDCIKVCISFFCMGLPSDDAQRKLLEKLQCSDGCRSLNYRGNGWPGYATAVDNKGETHRVTYDESWGKILGRDLMSYCRYCIDGIGEEADIACGDAWYIKDGKPDFDEHEGRNVIFARTELGELILRKASEKRRIELEEFTNYKEYLPVIQNSQFIRRATIISRIYALKLMGRPCPNYEFTLLKYYAKYVPLNTNIRGLLGMIRRIHAGKI